MALPTPLPSAQARPRQAGSLIARSLNFRRGCIGGALVVDPADFQVVAFLAALEAELDIGVLGNRRAPVGNEYIPAVIFEPDFLYEVRRNDLALCVLDET